MRPPHATAAGLLLWARRPGDIDRLLRGRHSAANAGSATLSAGVEAEHRLVYSVKIQLSQQSPKMTLVNNSVAM